MQQKRNAIVQLSKKHLTYLIDNCLCMKFYLLLLYAAVCTAANAQVLRYDSGTIYSHDIAIASIDTIRERGAAPGTASYGIRDNAGKLLLSMQLLQGKARQGERLYKLHFAEQDRILILPLPQAAPVDALLARLQAEAGDDLTPQEGLQQYLSRMIDRDAPLQSRIRRSEFGALELPMIGIIEHNRVPVASYRLVREKKNSVVCEFYQPGGALIATVKLKTSRQRFMTQVDTQIDDKAHQVRMAIYDEQWAVKSSIPYGAHILAAAQWLSSRKYL